MTNTYIKKVKPKKKVGEIWCGYISCYKCPLNCVNCGNQGDTLKETWDTILKDYPQLEPMRKYIESELDKEVKEC